MADKSKLKESVDDIDEIMNDDLEEDDLSEIDADTDEDENELEDDSEDTEEEVIPEKSSKKSSESTGKKLPEKSDKKVPAKKPLFDLTAAFANVPGVVCGDIGLELQRFPAEKIRFTTSARSLISIVSEQVVALKVHYNDDLGSIICFGGQCCEDMGLASVRYVFPVVEYDTNKKGVPISTEVKFKALIIGKDTYESIMAIKELQGSISKLDLLVVCTDENYQKISISAGGAARWRKKKEMAQEVVDFWREHMKDIILPVGRQMTAEEYGKKVGSAIDSGQDVTDEDLEQMFND